MPPNAQDIPPSAITIPDHKATEIVLLVCVANHCMATGVNAQNAYSSHICPK